MDHHIIPAFILGCFSCFILDIYWWTRITTAKRLEGGSYLMKIHEHYHVGLEMIIAGILLYGYVPSATYYLFGFGLAFIMAEWRQIHEIVGKRVEPGHPFAYGSGHFRASTAIGVVLTGILLAVILL